MGSVPGHHGAAVRVAAIEELLKPLRLPGRLQTVTACFGNFCWWSRAGKDVLFYPLTK